MDYNGDFSGYNISHGIATIAQQGVEGNRITQGGYIWNQYESVKSMDAVIGRWTDFYNPATEKTYKEFFLFANGHRDNKESTLLVEKSTLQR
jgi:hypothetical protein